MDVSSQSARADRSLDVPLLFATRSVRLFAYGFLSVVLVLYLSAVGLDHERIGLLLTLTLLGDTAVSLPITMWADRIGRRRMLVVGAVLMIFAAVLFALTRDFVWLLVAATIGVISPSGSEIGPFLSIEQAALSQLLPGTRRTTVFAWYNLIGSFATAVGALVGGFVCQWAEFRGAIGADIFRPVVFGYGAFGLVLAAMFFGLTSRVEVAPNELAVASTKGPLGLGQSRGIVAKLSVLFALDAFGGGFIVQSVMAYWFRVRFDVDLATLGGIFFGANILAGLSALMAARLANRFGLVNTMVFTHLPSNVLLILVPLMPNFPLALTLLLIRYSISQMDVPTRQSYVMAVVSPEERSAAAGVTAMARSLGAALSPWLATPLVGSANVLIAGMPFFLAGGIKVLYDLLLYREFVSLKPPEETVKPREDAALSPRPGSAGRGLG